MAKNLVIILVMALASQIGYSQSIAPAPADKSVVYIVRVNATGALINFTYFDGDQVIGRFNASKYIRYECEAGEHTFWARSENKSVVKANLAPGKIYILEAIPQMGLVKAGVRLQPIDIRKQKIRHIQRLMSKREGVSYTTLQLKELQHEMRDVIVRGKQKILKMESNNHSFRRLNPDMSVTPEQLQFVKKRRK